jgi:hypothetical protein
MRPVIAMFPSVVSRLSAREGQEQDQNQDKIVQDKALFSDEVLR